MDFNMKKSFKSQGSYKHGRQNSGSSPSLRSTSHEELPILSHQSSDDSRQRSRRGAVDPPPEFIVKVDAGASESSSDANASSGKMKRQASFGFVQQQADEDQSSKPTSRFSSQQRAAAGEISSERDMDEIRQQTRERSYSHFAETPSNQTSSREIRVSFEPSVAVAESFRRRHKDSPDDNDDDGLHPTRSQQQVLRCTSKSSFPRQASLLKLKTKSRLIDPPAEDIERMSGMVTRSGALRSGMMNWNNDDDEDDPFDDDVPDEFKRDTFNTLTVLEWLGLIIIIGALVCSLSIPLLRGYKFLHQELWKWEVMLLVLICGRLVSGWVIRIIVFFIEGNFLLRKRVLYFVYALRKGVQNCLWLNLVFLAWHCLLDGKVETDYKTQFLGYLSKILICIVVANFIWLLKTLMVKVLASSFHVSTYFDRIQESLYNQFVIETLSGPPLIEIQRTEEELERTANEVRSLQNAGATMPPELKAAMQTAKSVRGNAVGVQKSFKAKSFAVSSQLSKRGDEGITIDRLHRFNHKNISAWNMKRLMKIVRHGNLSTLDEQILGSAAKDESSTHITTEHEAKIAAKRICQNVARPGSKYIYLEDLMRFMREDEAIKTMNFFEGASETSRIKKSSLKNWVVNAFRERRSLALTLNDTKTAVNKLHQLIRILVIVLIIIIWLSILGIATGKYFVVLGSQIVVVSFIFGNTCKTLFESIIFLFIIHPFDVGDRCEVDGVQLIVEEMNILTTVFLRADNQKIVYPNTTLATRPIGNYYRSPDMGDAIEFLVHLSTPPAKITAMRQRIISYIESKKEHWYSGPMVIMKDVEDLNKLRMAVWFRHRINHQDMGEKFSRRSVLVEEIIKIMKDLEIQYQVDVSVRSLPPVNPFCPS